MAHFRQIGFESEEVPVPGIFRLTIGEYLVDYEIVGDSIEVRAIRHGRQRPPGFAIDEDFDFEDPEL
ncbi:type II toxin-antitoxin system RelE/ParE family toxin [Rhizobium tubonense]|uniref:type II toxin-antitoxin system RelE/ParE family toxin n=1 Tax=Rhizobium tubonense TaxID=484088 RepID=UPI001FCE64DB|nr:type II toxin-antitoxin system RelE/ParE family toxin [Rhizobium tubonense]